MILYGKLDQENQLIVTENVTWVWNAGSTMISLYWTWKLVDCFSYVEIYDIPITLRKTWSVVAILEILGHFNMMTQHFFAI